MILASVANSGTHVKYDKLITRKMWKIQKNISVENEMVGRRILCYLFLETLQRYKSHYHFFNELILFPLYNMISLIILYTRYPKYFMSR